MAKEIWSFSPKHPEWLWSALILWSVGNRFPFLGINQPYYEVDHLPLSNAKVKNAWMYISSSHTLSWYGDWGPHHLQSNSCYVGLKWHNLHFVTKFERNLDCTFINILIMGCSLSHLCFTIHQETSYTNDSLENVILSLPVVLRYACQSIAMK